MSSIAYKIKYHKVLNEFTLLFGNLLAIVELSVTTIESLIRYLLFVELSMSEELVPHFVFSWSSTAPSTGL